MPRAYPSPVFYLPLSTFDHDAVLAQVHVLSGAARLQRRSEGRIEGVGASRPRTGLWKPCIEDSIGPSTVPGSLSAKCRLM